MRRLITSVLVLSTATACADDPMTAGPPEPGSPAADIIRTGGIDVASIDGSVTGTNWPPVGWRFPAGFGRRDKRCWEDGRCAVGDRVPPFDDLGGPDSPHPVPGREGVPSTRVGYIATQKFYFDPGLVEDPLDEPDEDRVIRVTVLASGVEVDFNVPANGTWALSLDYAVLAAGGSAGPDHDDVARVLLVTDAASDALGRTEATPVEVHRSQLNGGACGTLELPGPDGLGLSTFASYDDCTGWQRLQFDVSEWAGRDDLTLRFLVEEVGGDDDKPIALVFDNVQVVETFRREGAVGTAIPLAVTPPSISYPEQRQVEFDTFKWTVDGCTLSSPSDPNPTATCSSAGTYEVLGRMTEPDFGNAGVYYALGTLTVTDPNTPPVIDELAGPADPVRLGNPVTITAPFTDPDLDDVHTATVDWGDGKSTSLTLPAGARSVVAMRTYAEPGVYPVEVTVADAGGEATGRFESVVVIDPDGGFVAGGGWFHSPAGAFRHDPTLTARLTIAFAARYHRQRSVPRGHTLVLRAFKFLFRSVAYDWLVVSDGIAQYQGTGTVNGKGNYGFLVTAVDGGRGWHSDDHFKIKVWDRDDGDRVVYDNAKPVGGGATSTLLRGGRIVVHEKIQRPHRFHRRFRDPTP